MRFVDHVQRRSVAVLLGCAIALGCNDDPFQPPPRPSSDGELFWTLTLERRAITMSTVPPYDTIQLVAVPRNSHGDPIPDLPAPTFTSLDLQRIQVTPEGLVHAIGTGTGVQVAVKLSQGNLTHTDTAVINITDDPAPPALASFTIHPVPPDSAKYAYGGLFGELPQVHPVALDENGNPLDVLVGYSSSDTTVATMLTDGSIQGQRPGKFKIYAQTTVYGVTRADTLEYTIGLPIVAGFFVCDPVAAHAAGATCETGGAITIAKGGIAFWLNSVPDPNNPTQVVPIDIVFDDPTNVLEDDIVCFCGSGNIEPFGFIDNDNGIFDLFRTRSFPVVGVYKFHSTVVPSYQGEVDVVDESTVGLRRVRP
jgi:hypothetical protein